MRLGDNWGAETSPNGFELEYANAANQIAPGIVDFAQSIATAGETIISAINRARTQVSMTNQQRDLLDLQLQRAQQGLPPLNVNASTQGGLTLTPTMLILGGLLLVVLLTRKG
jgi:hypothetical protein